MWLHGEDHGSANHGVLFAGTVSKTLLIILLVCNQREWVHEVELPHQIRFERLSIAL
jgi:hypothetical protein